MTVAPGAGGGTIPRARTLALCVAGLALAAYIPALGNGYVNWDDDRFILDNWITRGLSWQGVRWAFTTFYEGNWTPLTWLSHMVDGALFGLDPLGRHLTSVLLHAANAGLLLVALHRLTGRLGPAALVAALFALHPLNVESVAWIAERKNVLSTFFGILAIGAHARYAERPTRGRYAAVVALFTLGLLAKPMLVTLPFVLLLLDAWPLGRFSRRAVFEKVPLLALSAASSVITVMAQRSGGAVVATSQIPITSRFANAAVSGAGYLLKAVFPHPLSAYYPLPGPPEAPPLSTWIVLASAAVLAAATVAVVGARRRAPHLAVGWFWYLGTLVPVIGIVQVGAQAMADRYAYVPLIGIFIAVAWSLPRLDEWPPTRRVLVPVVALLLVLGALTAARTRVWKDSETLWRATLAYNPRLRIAHTNCAGWLAREGRLDEAIAHYREGLAIDPRSVAIRVAHGSALTDGGRAGDAIPVLEEALTLDPASAPARMALAQALREQGKPAEAEEVLAPALEARPDDLRALLLSAGILAERGRFEESLARARAALRTAPGDPAALFGIAVAQAGLGRREEAIATYGDVLRIDPDHGDAHYNLANALADAGRAQEAIAHYRAAIAADRANAEAQYNLALVLRQVGDRAAARAATEEALRIRREYPEAWYNLGVIRFEEGDAAGAVEAFREAVRVRPDYAEAHANLAAACAAIGRDDEARAAAATALALARAAGNEPLVRALEARLAAGAAPTPTEGR